MLSFSFLLLPDSPLLTRKHPLATDYHYFLFCPTVKDVWFGPRCTNGSMGGFPAAETYYWGHSVVDGKALCRQVRVEYGV